MLPFVFIIVKNYSLYGSQLCPIANVLRCLFVKPFVPRKITSLLNQKQFSV